VLPGVTVEAASPALIEKVRVAVTDGAGQYKIINLSSGTYTVTFTLPSFSVTVREGIVLTDGFTAPVNAELKIGALSDQITVQATAPIVDVQSLHQSTVMTREVMDAIPTGKNIQAVGILIPGTALQLGGGAALSRDVGGSGNMQQSPLTYHGSTNSVTAVDGLRMNDFEVSGQYSDLFNDGSFQEVSYTTGADSAEMGQGGLRINMVPKEGGNTFRGSIPANWAGKGFVADNCKAPSLGAPCTVSSLEGRGITNVPKVQKVFDFNPSYGGPIMKDRLWFQGTFRRQGVDKTVVDSFYDKNPAPLVYEADLTRPTVDDGWAQNASIRLTGQINQKNKLSWYFDSSNRVRNHWGASALTSPEASARQTLPREYTESLKYQSTLSNKLLFEAGFGTYAQDYTELYHGEICGKATNDECSIDEINQSTIYRVTDQNSGKNFFAYSQQTLHEAQLYDLSAKISYVTGSHNFSAGWAGSFGNRYYNQTNTGNLTMRYGVATVNADATGYGPNQVTLRLPVETNDKIKMDSGFFAQDKWTVKRATITAGLRLDWFVGGVGVSGIPANRWLAAHTFDEPEFVRTVPNWKDLSPRIGVAYDLFGTGKTALKVSLSRYVDAQTTGFAGALNPVSRLSSTQSLAWTDNSLDGTIFNSDGSVQDKDFNPSTTQDELAPIPANSTFGTLITNTTRIDQNIEAGYGVRGYTWEFDAGVQHELLPRLSLGLNYFRRILGGNGLLTDNRNVGPEDYYGTFCVTGPKDSRLPDGGGQQFCGIRQPIPNGKVYTATTDAYTTFRRNYLADLGLEETNYNHGADITVRSRFANGAFIQGGVSLSRTVSNTCYTQQLGNPLTATSVVSPFTGKQSCEDVAPFLPDIKLLGSYNLPWQFVFSATYQRTPGPSQSATWTFNQAIANANGWTISTTPGSSNTTIANATASVDLLQGKFQYDDPLNQLDIRGARRFIFGGRRLELTADLYNVFNSAWVFSESGAFGTSTTLSGGVPVLSPNAAGWLKPTNVLNSRMFKVGMQFDF